MEKLFSNISFIGGIHGVGKSTICNNMCKDLLVEYLSASEVLKWTEINNEVQNKEVKDVSVTQDRLIDGLIKIIKSNQRYLLDGHYCLLDTSRKIVRVPYKTFEAINPLTLNIIVGDISEIKCRLEARDRRIYDYSLLEDMQYQELDYANELSQKLNVPLNVGDEKSYLSIINSLQKVFNK